MPNSSSSRWHLVLASTLLLSFPASAEGKASADDWPAWRGPLGTGVAESSAPTSWSDEENIAWQLELPGLGFSTPVIWKGRIYLTTAIPLEEPPEPEPRADRSRERRRGGRGSQSPATVKTEFVVMCLNLEDGEEIWRKSACIAKPHEGYHRAYGSHASVSPITDGENLICSFGSQGIFCYSLDGELKWKFDPGVQLEMRRQFGEGANPILHSGTFVHVFDHEGQSFVVALDAASGEVKWRHQRDEPSSWSTPLVTEHDGVLQVIVSASNRIRSYELKGGKPVWECGGIGLNAIPSVVREGDLVIAMSGYREAILQAVKLGGEGDITDAEPNPVTWSSQRGTAYTASPVLHNGLYYTVSDGGKISCFDAASGQPHYLEERLPRGTQLKASPVLAGEALYIATEEGDVHLVALGKEYKLLRTNHLEGQFFVSSPVVVDEHLLLRSRTHLFCIAESN